MIFNHAVNTGPFIYCSVAQGANQTVTYYNDGDGHYHQHLYINSGKARAEMRTANDLAVEPITVRENDSSGQLIDVSESQGQYVTTLTKDDNIMFTMFNPIPASRDLSIEIVRENKTITAGDVRITIVCITGPMTVNGKTVDSLQHVKVFSGKTAELVLPEHAVCALVQDK